LPVGDGINQPAQQSGFQYLEINPHREDHPVGRRILRGYRQVDDTPGNNDQFWLDEIMVREPLAFVGPTSTIGVTVTKGILTSIKINGDPASVVVRPATSEQATWTRGGLGITLRGAGATITNPLFMQKE
jgi:hypothetical protein